MIREGILDSQRYWSVTIEARQLFWHLMLLADDFGCVSLAPAFVRRRCFDDGPAQDKIDRLVQQLFDADLVRLYEHNGARYGFIPRFGQRLRLDRLKHPEPPTTLLEGDDAAKKKFRDFKMKDGNLTGIGRSEAGPMTGTGRPEVEGNKKRKEFEVNTSVDTSTAVSDAVEGQLRDKYRFEKAKGNGQFKSVEQETIEGKTYAQWLADLSIQTQPQWTAADVKLAVEQALSAKQSLVAQ